MTRQHIDSREGFPGQPSPELLEEFHAEIGTADDEDWDDIDPSGGFDEDDWHGEDEVADEYYDYSDYQPDEAQEWHDFDPDC
jgi:hypothetical protein